MSSSTKDTGHLKALGFVFALCASASFSIFAQDEAPQKTIADERLQFLKELKDRLEPSHISSDVALIKKNIMRLGSFHSDLSSEAQALLLPNSAIAEAYLYDYSRVQNERLNGKMIELLTRFPTFQYPKAPLLFADYLVKNPDGKKAVLQLFDAVMSKSPALWNQYTDYMNSSFGSDIAPEEKIELILRACRAGFSPTADDRAKIQSLFPSVAGFWPQILKAELDACLQGL